MVVINNNNNQESSDSVDSGRVTKVKHRNLENEEIHMYLTKLKELVPFMPKNRKLSKLEVIQYVIDYICDLQSALDNHHAISAAAISAAVASSSNGNTITSTVNRQPLGVMSPNTTVCTDSTTTVHLTEKATAPESRTVSC